MIELAREVTDFWGIVMPAWIGAIGTVAASGVAVVALVIGNRARSSVKTVAEGLNSDSGGGPTTHDVSARVSSHSSVAVGDPRVSGPWSFTADSSKGVLRNTSGNSVTLVDLEPSGGLAITLHGELPVEVPPEAAVEFIVHRMLGGGAVKGVRVVWQDANGVQNTRTYFL